MNFSIIGQRIYDDNLENHLIEVLNEPDTVSCEALVAFITLNGLLRIGAGERGPLYNFITKPSTKFNWIVGIDNITTSDALATFKEFSDQSIPNYKVSAFSSKNIGIFHPKIFIFRKKNNTGTVIVGSNNLTQGGLFSNIEVSVKLENLESYELLVWEKLMEDTYNNLSDQIFEITEDLIEEIKELRQKQRLYKRRVKKKTKTTTSTSVEELDIEDIETDQDNTILIRQVPKAGNRSKQVHITLDIANNYFNIDENTPIYLQQLQPNEKPKSIEQRRLVLSNTNRNAKIEINGAQILDNNYPDKGRPILVFEKIGQNFFRYMLLLPDSEGHDDLNTYLESLPRGKSLPYKVMNLDELLEIWNNYPV